MKFASGTSTRGAAIAKELHDLRTMAVACGVDPERAVRRAEHLTRTMVLSVPEACERVRREIVRGK